MQRGSDLAHLYDTKRWLRGERAVRETRPLLFLGSQERWCLLLLIQPSLHGSLPLGARDVSPRQKAYVHGSCR
jgi:hypothetical protein